MYYVLVNVLYELLKHNKWLLFILTERQKMGVNTLPSIQLREHCRDEDKV